MNVGNIDKVIRIIAGVALGILAYMGTLGVWAWVVGAILLVTGIVGFCPAYKLLGMSTTAKEGNKTGHSTA